MAIIDNLQKISDTVWELPSSYKEGMRVPARIIATEKLVREMDEAVYQQISNVATLPGITRYALCMLRRSQRLRVPNWRSRGDGFGLSESLATSASALRVEHRWKALSSTR